MVMVSDTAAAASQSPIKAAVTKTVVSNAVTTPQSTPSQLSYSLHVTLEDLLQGCKKDIEIRRKIPVANNDDSNTTVLQYEEVRLQVEVGAGWKDGTIITYPSTGDYSVEHNCTGDLILVLTTAPHDRFRRQGADLIYHHQLSLTHALCGSTLRLHVLDGRILTIPLTDVISPTTKFIVRGEGLPNLTKNAEAKRGNIIIEFEISFPSELNLQQKRQIEQILG